MLTSELGSFLSEDRVKETEFSGSALGNSGLVTVYPETEEEIAAVLKYANTNGKKVSIEGGGTKRGYGGLVETTDILLSLARYNGIVEHTVGDMTVTVKSGTLFQELQDYLKVHNQKISLDPFLPKQSTIGGIISANDSGPKRLGYGSARDVVIGLRMVYPDGTVIRSGGKVVKNVAGYDMNKLFIGAMGTLGVISEVTVKLRPLAKYESLILLSFEDLSDVNPFAIKLLDSMMEPVAFELLSPTLAKKVTGKEQYTLAISFEDLETSVRYQVDFVKANQPCKTSITILSQNDAQEFWERFYSLGPSEVDTVCKIGVVNLHVLDILRECEKVHGVALEAHGGLGHGLCQVFIKAEKENIVSAITHLREKTAQLGGYVIAKHLPLALRHKVEVWGEKPQHFFLHEGIKDRIDPKRMLNHKRFVGGI